MHGSQTTTLTLSANGATTPVPMLEFVLGVKSPAGILVGFSGSASLAWSVEITEGDLIAAGYNPAAGN